MKIEVGKKYVLMNGDVIEIIRERLYLMGGYPYDCSGEYEISHEYKEDQDMSKLKLKVGNKYIDRCGEIVTIVKYDNEYTYNGYCYPYKGDNGRTYTEHGVFCAGVTDVNRDICGLAKEYKDGDNFIDEKNKTIDKEYVIGCIDMLISSFENDVNLLANAGGSSFYVNAIKHCINKTKEVFSEIM